VLLREFKADVFKLVVKKGLGRYDMDHYTFSERMLILLASFCQQPTDSVDYRSYLHYLAVNWRSIATGLVKPVKPFTQWNAHYSGPSRTEYISRLISHIHRELPTPEEQAVFISNIFVWKDLIEEALPGSRTNWIPFYGTLDYELARRHGPVLATFSRYESSAHPKKLLELMQTAKVKRIPFYTPPIGIEAELFKRKGRCFVLKGCLFGVFDPEIAMLCKLVLDIEPYTTDFPVIKVYAADLDPVFRSTWFPKATKP
jgi:hypothetical protein